jgi:hypothetical protein
MAGPRTWSAFEAEIAAGPSDRDALLSKAAALGGNQAGRFAGRAEPLTRAGLALAAETIGVAPEVMWAVVTVETSGCGFLPDRAPVILFERHEFRRRTGGRFDATHPDISGSPGGYGAGGENQHRRLARAVACDRRAALESASWSLGQIMGYNATTAGHSDVEELVMQFVGGEDAQLLAMARFVRNTGLHRALEQNDWAGFARGYNGPNYAANSYDTKLASAYAALCRSGLPDLDLRATQLMLTYEGFSPGSIDGRAGPRTDKAISEFRAAQGIGGSGFDSDVRRALYDRLPA